MNKFGLYTKTQREAAHHINICDMPSISHAEAYFAGVKQLSLDKFRDLFIVKEIKEPNKTLLYGNR